jgi:hypothetical protein
MLSIFGKDPDAIQPKDPKAAYIAPAPLDASVQHWVHGFGGVASAHHSGVGTQLEVLALIRTGRSAREHLGQPC